MRWIESSWIFEVNTKQIWFQHLPSFTTGVVWYFCSVEVYTKKTLQWRGFTISKGNCQPDMEINWCWLMMWDNENIQPFVSFFQKQISFALLAQICIQDVSNVGLILETLLSSHVFVATSAFILFGKDQLHCMGLKPSVPKNCCFLVRGTVVGAIYHTYCGTCKYIYIYIIWYIYILYKYIWYNI